MDPLVSVLIPVYNAGVFLRPSVESVLAQTYRNLEIILIDDGSTDGCMAHIEYLKDSRIQILRQKNAGKPSALNAALAVARGEFYAIHDADDISYPDRVRLLLQRLQDEPAMAAVFSGHDLRLGEKVFAPRFSAKSAAECKRDIDAMRMPAHDPTVMYRRSLVNDIPYDPELPAVEGFDHILRVGERHPMAVVGECLYSYRIHAGSATAQGSSRNNARVRKVLEKAAKRRGLDLDRSQFPSFADAPHRDPTGLVTQSLESVMDYRRAGRWGKALKVAWDCLNFQRFDVFYAKPLIFGLAPLKAIEWYRQQKKSSA